MKDINEMDVGELFRLVNECIDRIIVKQYGHGYKDGFEEGKQSEQDKEILDRAAGIGEKV